MRRVQRRVGDVRQAVVGVVGVADDLAVGFGERVAVRVIGHAFRGSVGVVGRRRLVAGGVRVVRRMPVAVGLERQQTLLRCAGGIVRAVVGVLDDIAAPVGGLDQAVVVVSRRLRSRLSILAK